MEKLIFVLFLAFIVSCSKPDPEIRYVYDIKTVEVPVYKSPLDNMSKIERPILQKFEFSKDGQICLDENNFKILVSDLVSMDLYIEKADKIFQTLVEGD